MKRFLISATVVLFMLPMFCGPASAVEYYKPCRWVNKSGAYFITRVSDEKLSPNSFYRWNYNGKSIIANAVSKWYASPTKATSVMTTFANSNVDMFTPTNDAWKTLGGAQGVAAITRLTDTNGYSFTTDSGSLSSTGQIKYAAIYVHPFNDEEQLSQENQIATIMHEMGHVYGMMHYYASTSIMNTGPKSPTLHAYDINEMNRFYP